MSISKEATLKILEVLADRVGRAHLEHHDSNTSKLLIQMSESTNKLIDATAETLPETLLEVATNCVIAVASMVAGVEEVHEAKADSKVIDVDAAVERAKKKMIERVKNKNVIISSIDSFD